MQMILKDYVTGVISLHDSEIAIHQYSIFTKDAYVNYVLNKKLDIRSKHKALKEVNANIKFALEIISLHNDFAIAETKDGEVMNIIKRFANVENAKEHLHRLSMSYGLTVKNDIAIFE